MATALILLGSTQLQKRIPTQIWPRATTLVLTVFGTFVSWAADLPSRGVAVVGELPAGLPSLAIPTITPSRLTELLPSVAMLVLVGFVESIAVAKTIAAKVGYEIDPDRELIGLGLSNVASALSGGFPSFGSLSRTPVNYITGARTRFAGVVTAALVLLVVLLFTPLLRYMPKPVMAAIIIVAVSKMADFAEFFHIWQQRKAEVALWLMPFLGTLIIGIDAGLLGSLVVCVLLVINHASLAHATLQVDQLRDRTPSTHTAPPQAPSKPHASLPPPPSHLAHALLQVAPKGKLNEDDYVERYIFASQQPPPVPQLENKRVRQMCTPALETLHASRAKSALSRSGPCSLQRPARLLRAVSWAREEHLALLRCRIGGCDGALPAQNRRCRRLGPPRHEVQDPSLGCCYAGGRSAQASQLTSLVAGKPTNGLPLLRLQSPLFYANAAQAARPPAHARAQAQAPPPRGSLPRRAFIPSHPLTAGAQRDRSHRLHIVPAIERPGAATRYPRAHARRHLHRQQRGAHPRASLRRADDRGGYPARRRRRGPERS